LTLSLETSTTEGCVPGAHSPYSCLRAASPKTMRDVDSALRAYLEEGFDQEDASGGLVEPTRRDVLVALAGARRARHPLPLNPKLCRATLDLDLDL